MLFAYKCHWLAYASLAFPCLSCLTSHFLFIPDHPLPCLPYPNLPLLSAGFHVLCLYFLLLHCRALLCSLISHLDFPTTFSSSCLVAYSHIALNTCHMLRLSKPTLYLACPTNPPLPCISLHVQLCLDLPTVFFPGLVRHVSPLTCLALPSLSQTCTASL